MSIILNLLSENVTWIDDSRYVLQFHIFGLMALQTMSYLRFRCLIPFEVTEADHWNWAILSLYILVRLQDSVITMLWAQCFSDWSFFAHLFVDTIPALQYLREV